MRAFRLAYDGRPYHGFQRQPDVATVEDALFDALRDLDVLGAEADRPAGYAAAGRTDAGVSALAQTVAFEAPDWLTPRALGGALPASVRAWASTGAPAAFHATHDAISREYDYHLHAPREGGPGEPPVDDERARAAAETLAGEHDFHNFTPDEAGTVRDLQVAIERDGPFLVLAVRAGGFARHMVRRLAALVGAVARGERPLADVERALGPDSLAGGEAIPTAPAAPLVLTDVAYPLSFDVDDRARESARAVFGGRRATHRTRARVAGRILDGL